MAKYFSIVHFISLAISQLQMDDEKENDRFGNLQEKY